MELHPLINLVEIQNFKSAYMKSILHRNNNKPHALLNDLAQKFPSSRCSYSYMPNQGSQKPLRTKKTIVEFFQGQVY